MPHHSDFDDEQNRICSALDHLRKVLCNNGSSYWKAESTCQESCLKKWAEDLGLLLDPEKFLPDLVRGGQEHDLLHDKASQRIIKVTRNGFFGLTPGIELALVSSGKDARRLHLWEASPYQYLERLYLHNILVPGINKLEGFIHQEGDFSIVTSQPRLDHNPVTEIEIDSYFRSLGFEKIASASYYRDSDNLGIFDAHDKNVLRSSIAPNTLIPFDIIPCQPDEGFLDFIQICIQEGHLVTLSKTSNTSNRKP